MSEDTTKDILQRLTKIETLLEKMTETEDLKNEALNEKIKVANNRIADLEKNDTWLWRTIVGGLIAGAIALLFK